MRRLVAIGVLVVFCMVILCGCSTVKPTPEVQSGYEVKDYQGNIVKLAQKPQRIVSLTLGTDEILLSLVAPERIAALTYLADDDGISNVAGVAKQVQGRVKANIETIIAMRPDLVIVADWQPDELIKGIRDAGISVYVYKTPSSVMEIKQVINQLAELVNEGQKGADIIATMDRDIYNVNDKLKNIKEDEKITVIRYSLSGASYGKGSLFDDMCSYAKVHNGLSLAGAGAFETVPKEKLVEINADLFILPTWDYSGKTDLQAFKVEVRNDPALQSIKAVKNNRLVLLPDKHINCASQYVVYGIQDIADSAYPEYFKQ